MHNRHFLGHNQSPSLQKKTSLATNYNLQNKGVSAGTCNQKHLENMHWATAGRVRTGLPFRTEARYTRDHYTKMNLISKQGYSGRARLRSWLDRRRSDLGRAGPGSSPCCYHKKNYACLYHKHRRQAQRMLCLQMFLFPAQALVINWANNLLKAQKRLSEQTRWLISIHKLTLHYIHTSLFI